VKISDGRTMLRHITGTREDTGNYIMNHEFIKYVVPLDTLNFENMNVHPYEYNWATLSELTADMKQIVERSNQTMPVSLQDWYDTKMKDFFGGEYDVYLLCLTTTSLLFLIVMCVRLYYASCFCIVDSIVLVPVIALIFLGMLLPLSWAITDDICKNSNKFVAAMNEDIRKILPVGFATEMHADYYATCPTGQGSPYLEYGSAKLSSVNILSKNSQAKANYQNELNKLDVMDERWAKMTTDLEAYRTLIRQNKLDLTNFQLNMLRTRRLEREASRREQSDPDPDFLKYPSNVQRFSGYTVKLDDTYVGYWLGNSLVSPINIGKISAAGPSKKTVRLTIEGMEKLLDDIEVALAKVAVSIAAVAQARQYIGSLNEQIDMVGAKFNEIPTTLETLEAETTSCHAMRKRLAPVQDQTCTELVDDFRLGTGVIFAIMLVDLFIILLNYLHVSPMMYKDSTTKPCGWNCCPCLCKGSEGGNEVQAEETPNEV
jgi:hypothetical protein